MATPTDKQISGMAGEFLTAGKLFKLGLQAAVTLGNAKSVDILAYNPQNKKNYNVQVKTNREKNCFLIGKENVSSEQIYVFVLLNSPNQNEDFFIVKGQTLLDNIHHFWGASYKEGKKTNMPAINYGPLKEFKNNWNIFFE
ncbi:MAG: hypothetical protein J5977_03670 [Fibrobacter sp.]|nr:hypothetical protein [Fibrobacter sp.]